MLARTLGRTLAELGETMSSQEFSDHWGDYCRSPWGDRRADIHAAQVVQSIANHAGKVRKDTVKLTDCLLDFDREEPEVKEQDPFDHFRQFIK